MPVLIGLLAAAFVAVVAIDIRALRGRLRRVPTAVHAEDEAHLADRFVLHLPPTQPPVRG